MPPKLSPSAPTPQHFTPIHTKAEFEFLIKSATGKALLLAYWPEDSTSNAVVSCLQDLLPKPVHAEYDIVDIYCFDVYSLPELAAELDISFVPTVMWFLDGVMDAIVWHEGVRVQGESVKDGVRRVVDRIKGGVMDAEMDSDEEWYAQGQKEKEDSDEDW
ncbi:hypothetical protein IAQ61_009352 [Plenodomus lingam]|uniref:Thioredoxin domain-containing protein n=1 Tax=Leptosphaeria maculans (strain JN3 / isolate v23.1.3 / race Av1-4-5-6-7-8) TaxID=985895 RepID=E4ZTV9_LEPMJ|nr:hypothetical protein LEMA_P116720.1 [Plenodomus lingam JN3]KAH9863077.1 hypothetical protein IAQ61_009352 [Plenodomus lingam]CBX94669.1 hypothetical protein LEMA_P116720.1 [Plenodomus lingam JN3]